ncbi:3'(2'),5'-bisphosphate nucleotidase CysQ [Streptomyces glaucescens]
MTGSHPLHTDLLARQEAARRAGELLRDGRPADLGVAATKSSPIDVVTEMDIAAQEADHHFLAERRPTTASSARRAPPRRAPSGIRWVIDPLDGTVNYLYGLPTWAVSIAAEQDGETVVSVVAAPMRGETYGAVRGRGARATGSWDGERELRCRPPPLDQALVSTGFNYVHRRPRPPGRHRPAADPAAAGHPARRLRRDRPVRRRRGHLGRLLRERGLHPWDLAAGSDRRGGWRADGNSTPSPRADGRGCPRRSSSPSRSLEDPGRLARLSPCDAARRRSGPRQWVRQALVTGGPVRRGTRRLPRHVRRRGAGRRAHPAPPRRGSRRPRRGPAWAELGSPMRCRSPAVNASMLRPLVLGRGSMAQGVCRFGRGDHVSHECPALPCWAATAPEGAPRPLCERSRGATAWCCGTSRA